MILKKYYIAWYNFIAMFHSKVVVTKFQKQSLSIKKSIACMHRIYYKENTVFLSLDNKVCLICGFKQYMSMPEKDVLKKTYFE